jgi:DNA-binding transcriptional LysR family regulator
MNIPNQYEMSLLPALHILLTERHVTKAAARMNLTQSAMSRVLAKLRIQFDDVLLVRTGNEYQLTPKAQALLPNLNQLLPEMAQLWQPIEFSPETVDQTITLSGTDMDIVLLRKGIRKLQEQADKLKLTITTSTTKTLDQVLAGEIDIGVSASDDERSGIHRKLLLEDKFVAVVDGKSHLSQDDFDLECFLSLRHGVFSIDTHKRVRVDAALANIGKQRQVVLHLPTFAQIPALVIDSDLVFCLPESFAIFLAKNYTIKLLHLPFDVDPINIYLYWHERQHNSELHRWVRNTLINT